MVQWVYHERHHVGQQQLTLPALGTGGNTGRMHVLARRLAERIEAEPTHPYNVPAALKQLREHPLLIKSVPALQHQTKSTTFHNGVRIVRVMVLMGIVHMLMQQNRVGLPCPVGAQKFGAVTHEATGWFGDVHGVSKVRSDYKSCYHIHVEGLPSV